MAADLKDEAGTSFQPSSRLLNPFGFPIADWRLILDPQTMKETRYQHKEAASTGIAGLAFFRILLWAAVASIILASAVAVIYWRRNIKTNTSDPRTTIPFRPRVSYDSSDVTISNTEAEPYLDVSLDIYVEATRYSLAIGMISPGETIRRPLRSLTNERGESFNPGVPRTSELEVRARFGGYDVHKDFPPPP